MVFCLFVAKRLETWKSFITSDPEAFVCNVLIPLTVPVSGFTHNPAFPAVSEFKMAGSAELVRLVDLAETDQSHRIFTTGHPVFFKYHRIFGDF